MKYMLLIYGAETSWTEEERRECMVESMQICEGLEAQGKWITSSPLHSVTTATCIRVRNGERQIIDGPFAETTEQLGGFHIIDVDDLDEAVKIASWLPPARKGTIEIRPLFPLPKSLSLPEGTARDKTTCTGESTDYILLVYAEDGAWPPEEHAIALEESVEICHHLHAIGQYISAAPLQPPATATWVRVRDRSRMVFDGPFLETKEQLGGYFVIRAANLDEAIAIAAGIPGSRRGTTEIRPLFPLPERSEITNTPVASLDANPL